MCSTPRGCHGGPGTNTLVGGLGGKSPGFPPNYVLIYFFWVIRAGVWEGGGVKPPVNPSMFIMIFTIIIHNTFEILIL